MPFHPRIFVPAFFFFFLAACSGPERSNENRPNPMADPEIQAIYDAADRRATEELLPYADADRPAVRLSFARVMASVQDSAALPALEDLLTDPIPYVRLYAAFAVGQVGSESSLPALERALKKATIPEVKAEVLEAVGKCADARAMEYVVYHDPNTATEETGKMYAIYRGALKGLLLEDHLRLVAAHLSSTVPETRLLAAFTLASQRKFDLQPYCTNLVDAAINDAEAEVRMAAMKALDRCAGSWPSVRSRVEADPDPRVRAAAMALAPTENPDEDLEALIVRAMQDGSAWVAMAAARKYAELSEPELTPAVIHLARSSEVPEVRAAIAANMLATGDTAGFRLLWQATPHGPARSEMLRAVAELPEAEDFLMNSMRGEVPESTTATAAWLRSAETMSDRRQLLDSLAEAAFTGVQPAKAALFAQALRNPALSSSMDLPDSVLNVALERYASQSQFTETAGEIRHTLAYRSQRDYRPQPPAYNNPPPWERIAHWPEELIARIYVGNRTIDIQLFTEEAPATVAYIASLADSGRYDGTAFHRVVPTFVSQGGGHRGDGYGSAAHTIRSEFSPLHYQTGSVGMASAGKDTESAQFFITHAPTPHLDGRYTLFGHVVDGFSHLDEVATGTVMDSVRIIGR